MTIVHKRLKVNAVPIKMALREGLAYEDQNVPIGVWYEPHVNPQQQICRKIFHALDGGANRLEASQNARR